MSAKTQLSVAHSGVSLPEDEVNIRNSVREPSSISGILIVNADDWGRDQENTDRTFECIRSGGVSSVSAMVFMEDSERAAVMAREHEIDAGLHLNLTTSLSSGDCPAALREHQQRLARYLWPKRLKQVMFHPGLIKSFEYVVRAQLEEYRRLYGVAPVRIDGHHHMHLCSNVLLGRLLPGGTIVRRNFSFGPGEKSWFNRSYRQAVDRILASRHRLTDFFFALPPLEPVTRLQQIVFVARQSVVELETHPIAHDEYRFLSEGGLFRLAGDTPIGRRFALPDPTGVSAVESV